MRNSLFGFGFLTLLCFAAVTRAADEKESADTKWKNADATVVPNTNPGIPVRLALPSPDGSYAITWPTREQAETVNQQLDNHLADLKTGKPVYRIDNKKDGDFEGKRWGGLSALWRADSRAVVLKYAAKWGPRAAWLLVIGDDGKVSADELTVPLRKELLKVFKVQAAKFTTNVGAEDFALDLDGDFSADGKTLAIKATGETNGKFIAGEPRVVGELTATFDLATHQLSPKAARVTEAGIVKQE